MTRASQKPRTLIVVGGGPKALAIHAKAAALRELGHPVPAVVILEHQGVGAHWRGDAGYTNGKLDLVTKPEKDLGFPYTSRFGTAVDQRIWKYSWQAYKSQRGDYAHWLDSDRPQQKHSDWAEYLRWAAKVSGADVIPGKVTRIEISKDRWAVTYVPNESPLETKQLYATGLVITGPGEARRLDKHQDDHPNISDGKSFWLPGCLDDFATLESGRIAIIGGGDTAAAVAIGLLNTLPRSADVEIDLFIPRGMSLSRGESLGESKWSSDPRGWEKFTIAARQEFLEHTERGVFSLAPKKLLDQAKNVFERPGRVVSARMTGKQVEVALKGETTPQLYRRAIVATGFKPWYFYKFFPDWSLFPFFSRQRLYAEKELLLSKRIRYDLSYDERWEPKLFLPMLAGLRRGPGFPNLGCLGLLSDRILGAYVLPT